MNYERNDIFPLCVAAGGNIDALRMLLIHPDICINLQAGTTKVTALHTTMTISNELAIKLLLDDERTDPSIQDYKGRTVLYYYAFRVGRDAYREYKLGQLGFYQQILRTMMSYQQIS